MRGWKIHEMFLFETGNADLTHLRRETHIKHTLADALIKEGAHGRAVMDDLNSLREHGRRGDDSELRMIGSLGTFERIGADDPFEGAFVDAGHGLRTHAVMRKSTVDLLGTLLS